MQYLVIVYDHEDAQERRMKARAEHIKATQSLMKSGKIVSACALVEDEKMIGSTIVTNFNSEEEFESWLANEPYVKNNVWNIEEIQIVDVKVMIKE
ncbi:MAG: YciI family protein [Arcobacteraceae bacterium]